MVLHYSLIDGNGRLYRGKVMKRILSGGLVFLCFFWCVDLVFGSAINSMTIGKRQAITVPSKIVYKGTLTGLRISSVDGTAFIDNAGATVPTYADGNHQISIFDSSGRELRGVLKAAGENEGLGDELVTNGNMETGDPPTGWTSVNATLSSVSDERTGGGGTKSINVLRTGGSASAGQTLTVANNSLLKYSVWDKSVEGTNTAMVYLGTADLVTDRILNTVNSKTTWINATGYFSATVVNPSLLLYSSITNSASTRFDDISFKQVTAPSSSGATIVSAKGGTTRNFTQKNSSFTYNAASYYVIVRKMP
jgi:hypothetical protein